MAFWKKIKNAITKTAESKVAEFFRTWALFIVECIVLIAIIFYACETNKLRVATDSLVKAATKEIEESKKTRKATEDYTEATKELLEVQKYYTDETHKMRLDTERDIDQRKRQFDLSIEPQLYGVLLIGESGRRKYTDWYRKTTDGSSVETETPFEKLAREKSGGSRYFITVYNPTPNNALNVKVFSYEPKSRAFYGSPYISNFIQPNQHYYFLIANAIT